MSPTDDDVLLERRDAGLLTLTLNRPERRNALDARLCRRLRDALQQAAEDAEVRAVLLLGVGPSFCVGGDVSAMAAQTGRDAPLARRIDLLRLNMEAARLLHDMPKPTIAGVRGAAAGAGLSLALACDLRVAGTTAKLTTAFAKVGLSGDYGGSWFLTRLLGSGRARELYLTSPVLSGADALSIGLVTRVAPDGEVDEVAAQLARSLAEGPTATLASMKRNLNLAEHAALGDCLDAEAARHVECTLTEDHREAAAAFVAKRAPRFSGR